MYKALPEASRSKAPIAPSRSSVSSIRLSSIKSFIAYEEVVMLAAEILLQHELLPVQKFELGRMRSPDLSTPRSALREKVLQFIDTDCYL